MSATKRTRLFPSYTLAELEAWENLSPEVAAKVADETKARKSGESKPLLTPQVSWADITLPTI